ncbi:nuclear nucleic acid-binding protein C1D-like [Branchiostoma floridae]|uniref:Nuclear nucleic acid-binding protein C1D n=1 Tax=Branchiostoma floridae TaxID=7739 RepID=A0A9J7LIC7_BRAFL|nr:nuclear nucleic acid-binding protein C1D-like [Branchiostoma floridae]
MTEQQEDYPSEIHAGLVAFSDSLKSVEEVFKPFLQMALEDVEKLESLDQAKLHLTAVYAINSLFWIYLTTQGIDPKDHPIKNELDRIRSYMNRVKEIEDKRKAAKLDKAAAKRIVKSALWEPSKMPGGSQGKQTSGKRKQQDRAGPQNKKKRD